MLMSMSSARQAPDQEPAGGGSSSASLERAILYQAALNAKGMTPWWLRPLVNEFGTLDAALSADPQARARVVEKAQVPAADLATNVRRGWERARRQVQGAVRGGLQVITWEDPHYPPALHDDPAGCAPLLYVEGELPVQLHYASSEVRALAVVGTRRATPGGLGFARDVGRALSREGVLVVSGLAIGIDGAAHEGALEALDQASSGKAAQQRFRWKPGVEPSPRPAGTVAVLGGGHGHLHPAMHAGLARRIVAAGGAVISEWAPDVAPLPYRFLQRNRVVTGLSRGVLVVEAGARSGTNKTVAHALDQGRITLAVPAAPWSVSGAGCLAMIRDGAEFVFEYSDVLAWFSELVPRSQQELANELRLREHLAAQPGAQPLFQPHEGGYSGVEMDLLHHMRSSSAVSLDYLAGATRHPAGVLIGALAMLELAGAIETTPGGLFRLRDALPERKPERK